MIKKLTLCVGFAMAIQFMATAQSKIHPYSVKLSEDGKKYIKFGFNAQIWGRYTELNPNSKVGSNVTDYTYDLVIRRLRIQAMGMLTEKVYFHFQLGNNNINFTQNVGPYNSPFNIMDALGEYHFSKKFQIGGGLCGYGAGTTRYSAQSSTTQLTLDAPIYQQNNISGTYGNRNLSVYAKGEIAKFNYRVVVTNPYKASTTNKMSTVSSVSTLNPSPQFLGMLTYQFFEKESIEQPYNRGTYLGTKKVLNIGVGYMHQSSAMWRFSENATADTVQEDMNVFGADVFFDNPLGERGAAITLYGAYNNCDYGKNYIRNIATPNLASSGTGSGFIGIGTGNIFYGQVGYLMNKNKNEEKKGRAQFYVASEVAVLDALKTPMTMIEGGVNYYINGSFGPKVSLGYQSRSVFSAEAGETKLVESDRKGMLVLQLQVSL